MNYWYNHTADSKEFKTGLKQAPLYQLSNLLVVFRKRQKEGQKVTAKITAIRKEKERRRVKECTEALREKMYRYIDLYGPQDKRTLEVSQELDKLIAQEMKGEKDK